MSTDSVQKKGCHTRWPCRYLHSVKAPAFVDEKCFFYHSSRDKFRYHYSNFYNHRITIDIERKAVYSLVHVHLDGAAGRHNGTAVAGRHAGAQPKLPLQTLVHRGEGLDFLVQIPAK